MVPTRRPLYLRDGVAVEATSGGFALHRQGAGVSHPLALGEALVMALFGQLGDVDLVTAHLGEVSDVSMARAAAADALARWGTYLGPGTAQPISPDLLQALQTTPHGPRPARQAAPAAISWLVTLTCNRRCPYCYYKVLPWDGTPDTPADATFSLGDAERLVDEMAMLGTSALYLTGGEPLLRADLPQIIRRASTQGIRVFLNTKHFISEERATALFDAGLHEVSYSLDSAEGKAADALAGHKGYLQEAVSSISALLRAGVRTKVNAVATSVSASSLRDLARLCLSIGVPELVISPFMDPSFAQASHARLIRFGPPLGDVVAGIREDVGDAIRLTVGSAEAAASGQRVDCSDRLLCEVGIQTLDLLPDGRATRCRYAPNDASLVVGDLRRQTLLDVWNGAPLRDLTFPAAEQFGDSACASCGAREACSGRGRCVVGAKRQHGAYLAPDAACVR